jgi:hypothetical protein
MSEAKIEIQIGDVRFSGEGDQDWLTQQLDKILDKVGKKTIHNPADFSGSTDIAKQSLATFLKSKNATTQQVDKFLATAIWVEAKENKNRLKTSDVSSALSTASQSKLNNPADKLNKNVNKGFCEKDGKEFFVTQEGREHMKV